MMSRRKSPSTLVASAIVAPGFGHVDRVVAEVRHPQLAHEHAAVRVRVRAHAGASPSARARAAPACSLPSSSKSSSALVALAASPRAASGASGAVRHVRERDLVRPPEVLDLLAVDLLRAGPALRRPHDDHRPLRPLRLRRSRAPRAGSRLISAMTVSSVAAIAGAPRPDRRPRPSTACSRSRRRGSRPPRAASARAPSGWRSCSRSGGGSAGRRRPWPDSGTCSSATTSRAARSPPRRRRRRRRRAGPGCRSAAPNACETRVAELATLVDRARHLGGGVARDPARERELLEELLHALGVLGDVRVELAVRPLEVRVGDDARGRRGRGRRCRSRRGRAP